MFHQKSIMQHILIICSVAGTNTQHVEIQRQLLFSNSPLLHGITFSLFFKASPPRLCDFMDCSPSGSSCPRNFPGKDTGMGKPFPSSRDLPDPEIEPGSSSIAGRFFTAWATKEAPITPIRGVLSQVVTAIRIHIDC